MENQFQEGQLILCTVEKVIGTTVFVKIENNGEGTITLSEIAPGRIRNLRDYVVPGKKIVCKILRVRENAIQLSLRRVGINERKDFLQKVDREKSNKAILKTVLGEEQAENLINEINKTQTISSFFESLKEDSKQLEKLIKKEQSEKILKILESKKEKPKQIKQVFRLSSKASDGIVIVKDIIQGSCKNMNCIIAYLAAGKYSLSIEGKDFREIKNKINSILESIEKQAKKQKCEFIIEKS